MADYCCEYTFAGITINNDTGDTLIIGDDGEIVGLDGAPLRSQVDPQGQSDGGIVHPKFFGPRVIAFAGEILIRSVQFEETVPYITAINTLEAAVIIALEGARNSASNLAWTPTGLSARTISCTYGTPGGEIQFSGMMQPGVRKFAFSLIAAEPTIS
jgi:hypothetical protein